MASNTSEMKFANDFSQIKFIRRVLLEFGVFDETDTEIEKAIILAKIDETQEEMDAMFRRNPQGEALEQENKK